MTIPTDERVYTMLADCGSHATWAAKRLRCPVTTVHEAVHRLVLRRHPEPVDVVYENRKHRALAELRNLEIVR